MNFLKNNFTSLIEVKKNRWVLYSWFLIEVLQKTNYAVNFLVMHLSSFFGAIVFLILIDFYKKSKWLKIAPIIIEIIHSLYFQRVVDIEDIIFSILGIITHYFIFSKSENNKS